MKQEWKLPSLKEAQKRTRREIVVERALFAIPQQARTLGAGRKYLNHTYGCQANERDSETIAGILDAMGYTACDQEEEADLILLNTCAIRKNAEDKVIGELGALKRLKRQNPDLIFAVCGCMAQEEDMVELMLKKYPQVDLIFGTHNIHRLPQLLMQAAMSHERTVEIFSREGEVIENLPVRRFGSHKAWVNIMYGCDKFCTYCIVPYTRGRERSRDMADILAEIRELKAQGYREVTLLGQNVNAYGKDRGGSGFAELLRESARTGIDRIRFTTSHPWDFTDEMIEAIASFDNIMPSIHLPVQSGSSEILKLMGRRYTREEYLTLFHKIRQRIPNCAVTTDIIVGFPNETEEQFAMTLSLVDECRFDGAFTFIYSPRQGTPAAAMADNVPIDVKNRRLQQLNDKIAFYAHARNEAYLGKTVRVLVDGPSKKNDQVFSGYSETNKLVNFTAGDVRPGDLVDVEITEIRSWSLNGRQIAAAQKD